MNQHSRGQASIPIFADTSLLQPASLWSSRLIDLLLKLLADWSLDLLICNTTSIPFIPTEDTTEFSCLYQAGFNREFIFTGRTRKLNHKSPLSDCLHECGCAALRIEERRFGSDPSRDLSIFLHSRAVKGG